MIQSMTGFGNFSESFENQSINIEIKSLNSKTADVNLRLPQSLRSYEMELRKHISERLIRGKIDVFVQLEKDREQTPVKINTLIVKSYMEQLRDIAPESSDVELLPIVMRMPEIFAAKEEEEEDTTLISRVKIALNNAIDELERFRIQEGDVLKKDFLLRIETIDKLLCEVEHIEPERSQRIREKLSKAIEEIPEADLNRFEQELIYYLEKYDISEEKIRLKNHLDYFLKSLDNETSNGRKLGFIAQEIGREINTLGSKANFAPIQKIVVQMKDELEKIKEQILNVL